MVHPSAVADAGGLLALVGLVEAVAHDVDEVCALDASALLLAEYLTLLHEGTPARAAADYGVAARLVSEWFPVRPLAMAAMSSDYVESGDVDSAAALVLAETLQVPLVTKNRAVRSRRVSVLHA